MKRLLRGTIFVTLFFLSLITLSTVLYLIDLPWLSPNIISPTYGAIAGYLLSRSPRVKNFINGPSCS